MMRFAGAELHRSLRHGRLRTLLTVLTVANALFILSGLILVTHNLELGLADFRSATRIHVLLADETDPLAAAAALERLPGVAATRAWSRAEAFDYFRSTQGEELARGIMEALGSSPFPAFIEVRLSPGVTAVASIAEQCRRLPGVSDVLYGAATVERLTRLAIAVRRAGTVINLCLVVFVLLIIINGVRAAVHARAADLAVLSLCGATEGQLTLPFVLEGALFGAVGAVLSLGALALIRLWLAPHLSRYFALAFLPDGVTAGILIFSMAVGAFGGLIAAREALLLQENHSSRQ